MRVFHVGSRGLEIVHNQKQFLEALSGGQRDGACLAGRQVAPLNLRDCEEAKLGLVSARLSTSAGEPPGPGSQDHPGLQDRPPAPCLWTLVPLWPRDVRSPLTACPRAQVPKHRGLPHARSARGGGGGTGRLFRASAALGETGRGRRGTDRRCYSPAVRRSQPRQWWDQHFYAPGCWPSGLS